MSTAEKMRRDPGDWLRVALLDRGLGTIAPDTGGRIVTMTVMA